MKGLPIKPREVITPPPVIDLMAALKRSLAEKTTPTGPRLPKKRARAVADRRQRSLLLPVAGGRARKQEPATKPTAVTPRPRKKA